MCGIAGAVSVSSIPRFVADVLCDELADRGPDDSGYLFAEVSGKNTLLAQTRLSIIDLSEAGHQPMVSPDGKVQLVFNGEIYNYLELRQELLDLGHEFRSASDTEVLLHAWMEWGEAALNRLDGMFAAAVLDLAERRLFLFRDAFGVKPLYVSQDTQSIAFASTPAALVRSGFAKPEINQWSLVRYLTWGQYDLGEDTFFKEVFRVPSGSLWTFDLDRPSIEGQKIKWWKPDFSRPLGVSFEEAAREVRKLFLNAVRIQMRSDVPIGFALSGGVDSSAIICAARKLFPQSDIHAFAYLADDPAVSEEKWVGIANEAAQAELHSVTFSVDAVQSQIEAMQVGQGEPFSSSRIFAQYKVFEEAKRSGVKVVLEGQGGDELFAGYHGFAHLRVISLLENLQLIRLFKFLNSWRRWPGHNLVTLLGQVSTYLLRATQWPTWIQLRLRSRVLGESLREFIDLKDQSIAGFPRPYAHTLSPKFKGRRVIEGLLDALTESYIPQLVRQGDRNAMAHSIENRVPFLSLPLVEYVLSLPEEYLIGDDGQTKRILRAAMRGIVPDEILDRRDKVGFETPQDKLWRAPRLIAESWRVRKHLPSVRKANVSNLKGKALIWRYLNAGLWLKAVEDSKANSV